MDDQSTQEQKAEVLLGHMKNSGTLPALSDNVQDICSLTERSNSCAADLASIIMRDCGLSSNLLSIANSVLYSPRYPVKTVACAVTLLGFAKVRSMALGLTMFKQTMKSLKDRQLANLYASSYFSGTFAMSLAREMKYSNPEEIFVAGLLHRLPWLALANTYPEKFGKMEKMINDQNIPLDDACLKLFDVKYSDICNGLTKIYHLPDNVAGVLQNNSGENLDNLAKLIEESDKISHMLFGNKLGGEEILKSAGLRIGKLLNQETFSVSNFIKTACKNDANISRFFKLDTDDVEMMVNALEWGKGNPAQITSKFVFVDTEDEETDVLEKDDPELIIGHFLTELLIASKRDDDINHVIMLAQEALFRCIQHSEVFTTFFDKQHSSLIGRFYAGNLSIVKAQDFNIKTDKNSAITEAINENRSGEWKQKDGALHLPYLKRHMSMKHAIFSPIIAATTPVGLYFVVRNTNMRFSDREKIWLEQIAQYVGKSFETRQK